MRPGWTRRGAAGAALLGSLALAAGWLGNLSRLTRVNDRACVPDARRAGSGSRLQGVLDAYGAERSVGLQAAVVFPDGAQWDGSSGLASRERECPVSAHHLFGIGSVTKLYTAALVMRQVEAGAISLDDPISRWLELPYAGQVTVRMLLDHTSGIPDYTGDATFLLRYLGLPGRSWRPGELADVIDDEPLAAEPGLRHEYSNSNYLLLGIILEKAGGTRYAELLREMTGGLGLRDTFYASPPGDAPIANAYDEDLLHLGARNLTGMRASLLSGAYAAGGIVATAGDVARFTRALFAGELVSGESLSKMTTFVDTRDENAPERRGYGLGVRRLVVGGDELVGHTGAIPGYSGFAVFGVEERVAIAVLANLSVIEQERLLARLWAEPELRRGAFTAPGSSRSNASAR